MSAERLDPFASLFDDEGSIPAERRAAMIGQLRRLQRRQLPDGEGPRRVEAACELCGRDMPEDHRHLLQLEDRRIVCVCDTCWVSRSGDAEFRPAGTRVLWLEDFELPEDLWSALGIPIGLAFFFHSGAAGRVVALYPSPAGATESELDLASWEEIASANPVLRSLEPDAEALLVNRTSVPPVYAIAPVDECYRLVGLIRSRWEGISGGPGVTEAIAAFFDELAARSRR